MITKPNHHLQNIPPLDDERVDERPLLTLDCVILGFRAAQLQVLLVKWDAEGEEAERWALPGGYVKKGIDLDASANIVLENLTGVSNLYMEQLHAFGAANRVLSHRAITIAYYALISPEQYHLRPGVKGRDVKWFNVDELPELIYDHHEIIQAGLKRLRKKVREEPIGFELLPEKFTLTQIQVLYETILGRELDKRNFRKKLLKMNLLTRLDEIQQGVAHRAARLYSFDKDNYSRLKKEGFNFDL